MVPADDLGVLVSPLVPGEPDVVGSLGILPGEVVLLPAKEERHPLVAVPLEKREVGLDPGGGVVLRVRRIEDGELCTPHDEHRHANEGDEEGLEGGEEGGGSVFVVFEEFSWERSGAMRCDERRGEARRKKIKK